MKESFAVIFDMDGVIFDTERLLLESWTPVAEAHDVHGIVETLRSCIGRNEVSTREIIFERFGEDFPLDEYQEEVRAVFREKAANGIPEKAGARELLAELAAARVPLALASSTREEVVRRELAEAGLLQHFDAVIGGDRIERGKPAPDIFLKAAELLGKRPEECFVIEDSPNGIRAAAAAGMTPLMVPDQLQPDEQIRALAHRVFDSLKQVQIYLRHASE